MKKNREDNSKLLECIYCRNADTEQSNNWIPEYQKLINKVESKQKIMKFSPKLTISSNAIENLKIIWWRFFGD